MLVRDVMGPSMGGADAGGTLRDAWARLEALDLDPLPVVESSKVVGLLRREAIQRQLSAHGFTAGGESVRNVMEPAIGLLTADEEVEAALQKWDQTAQTSERLPVVDRDGTLVGVVAVRQLRQHTAATDDGVTAAQSVNSIDSMVSYDDDPVDYESDSSFPASDPPSESSAGVTAPTRPADTT
jgi:CBS domain-containing protein